ncbi:MAG TPA: N-6 DNA methylase [Pseudonocardiaceae bacterium]|jgi:hypothetical protein|nr:N-6 DNA methylase [Pseudonocardiaceae bacterium]
MSQDAAVSAGDIARLVDVGRAAVSNWRRRYEDFPKPVGGTASSPLFSLTEVEEWLRRNGKTFSVSLGDRVWQQLRSSVDDLRLGDAVRQAGEVLLGRDPGSASAGPARASAAPVRESAAPVREPPEPVRKLPEPDRELAGPVRELADELGPVGAFEFLCDRYREAHARQLAEVDDAVAASVGRLVRASGATVLDPACGLGSLALAGSPGRVLGQDSDPVSAAIADIRLALRGLEHTIVAGDSLRDNGFSDSPADVVVCDPPAHDRNWGHAELTGDPRWTYGLPPRGEPELAWVQHCLAQVRPGGLVAVLLAPAVAGRRAGRRIRGNLLRGGALRAIVSLGDAGPDLWLLRRPAAGERAPERVLLLAADGDLAAVQRAWDIHRDDPDGAHEHAVRIIDLLDDDIDLTPARHRPRSTDADFAERFSVALHRFRAESASAPDLVAAAGELPRTTVGELIRDGAISITHSPGAELRRGDVIASRIGDTRVVDAPGEVLDAQWTRYRPDPLRLDSRFLAGVLRSATAFAPGGSSRIDLRRTSLPRLPLAEQRAYGLAFDRLLTAAEQARATAEAAAELVRLGFDGLIEGRLRPGSRSERGSQPERAAFRKPV